MTFLTKQAKGLMAAAALACLMGAGSAHAVQFTLSDQTADTWTYTLTYDPLDNYAVNGAPETATIKLTGLSGVVSAGGPTSTDFADAWLDQLNRNWVPSVLSGGTEVVWTHVGPGTGNFDVPLHVFGFTVMAPGASSGPVSVVTSGFSTDTTNGYLPRDINTTVTGPVPEPQSWGLMLAGLVAVGGLLRHQRKAG